MSVPEHAAYLLRGPVPQSGLSIPLKAFSTQDSPTPKHSQAWEEGIWEKEHGGGQHYRKGDTS